MSKHNKHTQQAPQAPAPLAVLENTIVPTVTIEATVMRGFDALALAVQFEDERPTNIGSLDNDESITLGLGMFERGKQTSARGLMVLGARFMSIQDEDKRAEYRLAIRDRKVTDAVAAFVNSSPKDKDGKAVYSIADRDKAAAKAKVSFQNLDQMLKAAVIKAADSLIVASVWEVLEVKSALGDKELPAVKEATLLALRAPLVVGRTPVVKAMQTARIDAKEAAEKARLQLINDKAAAAAAAAAAATAPAAAATLPQARADEVKVKADKEQATALEIVELRDYIQAAAALWAKMIEGGYSPLALRNECSNDVKALAVLAGIVSAK